MIDTPDSRQSTQPIDLHVVAEAMAPILLRQSDALGPWYWEFPGYIAMHTDGGGVWNIGTANGVWGADLYIDQQSYVDGESPDHSVQTDVPGNCTDPERIALALYAAMVAIDGEETSCPECERSFGPHYTGPCKH